MPPPPTGQPRPAVFDESYTWTAEQMPEYERLVRAAQLRRDEPVTCFIWFAWPWA